MKELYTYFLKRDNPNVWNTQDYEKWRTLVNEYNGVTGNRMGTCGCSYTNNMNLIKKFLHGTGQI